MSDGVFLLPLPEGRLRVTRSMALMAVALVAPATFDPENVLKIAHARFALNVRSAMVKPVKALAVAVGTPDFFLLNDLGHLLVACPLSSVPLASGGKLGFSHLHLHLGEELWATVNGLGSTRLVGWQVAVHVKT